MEKIKVLLITLLFCSYANATISVNDPLSNNFNYSLIKGETSTFDIEISGDPGDEIVSERIYGSDLTVSSSCVGTVFSAETPTCVMSVDGNENASGSKMVQVVNNNKRKIRVRVRINRVFTSDESTLEEFASNIEFLNLTEVDFGEISGGNQNVYRTVYIKNIGDKPTGVMGKSSSTGRGFSILRDACSGKNLLPNTACKITTKFTSMGYYNGDYTGSLIVNRADGGNKSLSLLGTLTSFLFLSPLWNSLVYLGLVSLLSLPIT